MGPAACAAESSGSWQPGACPQRVMPNLPELGPSDIYSTEYLSKHSCHIGSISETKGLLSDENAKVIGAGGYPRIIARDGECNVIHRDATPRLRRICVNVGFVFHVMISLPIWKLAILFLVSYFLCFIISGSIIWFSISDHKDFFGINSWVDAVIFAGYTMTTVGFGNQYPNHPESSIFPLAMVVFGLLMDSFWLGVIFARISNPRPLRHTVLLSKVAVLHNNTFECRAVNLRHKYPWIDLSVKLSVASFDHATSTVLMENMKVDSPSAPFLELPYHIKHNVTPDSPLNKFLQDGSFSAKRVEVIVELNGQDPLTGNCMIKRFSYIADEIVPDHVFVPILTTEGGDGDQDIYSANLVQFHETQPGKMMVSNAYGATPGANEQATPKRERKCGP